MGQTIVRTTLFLAISLVIAACGNGGITQTKGNSTSTPKPGPPSTNAAGVETVKVDSPDGVILFGSYYPATTTSSPALLLLHQWQSDRHSYDEFARSMNAKGYAVLSIDGRGFGESTKTADGRSVSPERTDAAVKAMLGDVDTAFGYLTKKDNVDPKRIGIVGASYGSSLAILYAADHPNVMAVALLSPGTNYFGNMATEPAVRSYGDRPLLLVAAEDDKASADSVDVLKKASDAASHTAVVYSKGGHGTSILGAGVGLQERLEEFFDKSL